MIRLVLVCLMLAWAAGPARASLEAGEFDQHQPATSDPDRSIQASYRPIALVALRRDGEAPARLDATRLNRALLALDPALEERLQVVSAEPGTLIVGIDGIGDLVVMAQDAPISWREIARPVANAARWPTAEEDMRAHTDHVIVSTIAAGGDFAQRRSNALAVTMVAAALAGDGATGRADPVGVYWGGGAVLTPAARFVKAARRFVAAREMPVYTWVTFVPLNALTETGEMGFGITTRGLLPLLGMEVELQPTDHPRAVVINRTTGVIHYLMDHGPVVRHGDTMGISDDEVMRAVHVRRGRGRGVPVLELTIERLSTGEGQLR